MGAELKCAVQRNMPEQIRNVYLGCLTAFRGLASLVMCVRAVKHPNRYSFRFVEAVLHSRFNAAGRVGFQAHLAFEDAMLTIASSDTVPGCVYGHRPVIRVGKDNPGQQSKRGTRQEERMTATEA